MAEVARTRLMNAEEFALWEQTQVERYELVDGIPQPKFVEWDGPKMMVGATNRHSSIVANLMFLLKGQLRGTKCRPYAADGKVGVPAGNIRYADISIDCGPYHPASADLSEPVAVIDILSRSTQWIDQGKKLHEYQSVASIRYILLLMQDERRGQLWIRGEPLWDMQELSGADAIASFPATKVQFTLGAAYEDAL